MLCSGTKGPLVSGSILARNQSLSSYPFLMSVSGSFHVSVLAGRILLKDFCYHSSNQTIKVVRVQLRWQYWFRSFTPLENMPAHSDGEEQKGVSTLCFSLCVVPNTAAGGDAPRSPRCRFHATFEGIEWFIYNRTAAFDNIVAQMEAKIPDSERRAHSFSPDGAASHLRQIFSMSSAGGESACSLFSQWCHKVIVHHAS